MARYDDEAELFAEDFQAGYVKNLLRLQQEVIKLPDSEEHYDIYLAKKLYPVLLPGVELLAREIDRLTNKESQGKLENKPILNNYVFSQIKSMEAFAQGSIHASSWQST